MIAQSIVDWLEAEKGLRLRSSTARSVSGGCINEVYMAETEEGGLIFTRLIAAKSHPWSRFVGPFTISATY